MHRLRLGTLTLTLVTAVACSAGGAGTAAAPPAPAKASDVAIKGFLFAPARLDVAAGTTVTWTNSDNILHTATSGKAVKADDLGRYTLTPDAKFDGTMETSGATFSFTFTGPGDYEYYCSRHNNMTGSVSVK
jgi:plastocyanin